MAKALDACRRQKAKLVIAKLDRLSRNLAFIATLMESGVEFVAVDNPHATKLTVHILAAVAQHEREMISERTKAALQAARARGTRLGNPRLDEAAKRGTAALKANARRQAEHDGCRRYCDPYAHAMTCQSLPGLNEPAAPPERKVKPSINQIAGVPLSACHRMSDLWSPL